MNYKEMIEKLSVLDLKGKCISCEGGDGSGKGTMIAALEKTLKDAGIDVLVTREPGGVRIAEQIRNVIVDTSNTEMNAFTEVLLYTAARVQHLEEKIYPALNSGKFVILDRFVDSSLAYQGYARGLGIDKILDLSALSIGEFMPNKTIYLDIEPEIGLNRVFSNDREVNRLDLESLDFHKRVREGYHILKKDYFPERIEVINADQEKEAVLNDVLNIFINGGIQWEEEHISKEATSLAT